MIPEHLNLQSADGCQLNIDALYQIAPSCFTEVMGPDGKTPKRVVNFDVLRQLLGDAAADTGEEFYQFTWPGKAEARREAARPIKKTLRPVKEDSVDWDTTQNLYIEGDNLEVLKLLQKSYLGKVKMIYIDPPYNTGKDFVYNDDFSLSIEYYEEASGNVDELGLRYRKNTDSNGRFHSDWCSMMYSRLIIAQSLLSDNGVIFLSIDDREVDNLKKICNNVFGESNFVASFIVVRSEGGGLAKRAVIGHDYLLAYAKSIDTMPTLGRPKDIRGKIVEKDGEEYWIETDWFRQEFGKYGTCHYEDILIYYNDKKQKEIDEGLANGDYILIPRGDKHVVGRYRKVADDTSKFYTILKHLNKNGVADLAKLGLEKYFDFPKPVSLLKEIILGATIRSKNKNDIILDFFSGSSTTAQAVLQQNAEDRGNRRFIMVQLPEETDENSDARRAGYNNIPEIARERIRRAGRKIKEEAGLNGQDLDTGFRVFRVDDSNMEDVYFQPKAYSQDKLDMLLDNVKADRTDLDLLFGAMLDWGVQLSLPMSTETVDGRNVYVVNEGDLVACFAENITEEVIEYIADYSPLRVLLRDSCFSSDADKINIFEQFKQRLGWSDEEAYKNIRVI